MQTSETPLAKRRQQQLLQQATQLQGAVPPSTAIRSRFLTITEQPAARGTKRRLDAASTGSSPGIRSPAPWMLGLGPGLDTPVRARPAQATASLLDSLLQSPSRSILAAVQRDSSAASQANALRRAAEDARFDAQQAALERERERSEAVQLRQALEAEVAAQAKRVEALERDRRWLFEQEEKLTCARRGAEAALARQRAAYEARVDQMDAAVRDADRRLDDVARAMRRQAAEHASEKEALLLRATRAEREKESLMQSQAAREEGLLQSQAAREESLMQSQAAREESLMRSQAAGEESLMQSQAAGGESLMQSQAAGGDAMPIRESKRDPPSLIAQLERDLAEQCAYIKAVEQQNRHLRAEAKRLAQAAAAQEQEREAAQALRAKVQRLEDAQRAHAETAAQLSALQQERAQWQRVFEAPGAPNAGSPFAVARTVADQRHALRALETRAAALQAACAESEQHRVSAETRCEALAAECARLRAQADAEAQRAARLDGARLHAVREADFARAQLHSYDREEASMMPGNYDAHKALRIRQLEMFVDELRAWVAAADSGADADPARTNAVNAASAELLRGYREDAESARDDYRRLLERFEALEREAARLELQ
ncbi:coiled-coil domain-containing protein mad1, partial [Kickxella alabastrina]